MRAIVTGANRGIGLEFVTQLLLRADQVEAGVRDPQSASELNGLQAKYAQALRVRRLDIASDDSVQAWVASMGTEPVDLLINNAGVGGWRETLDNLQLKDMAETINVNALGPFRVTRALLPLLRAGSGRKVAHITSAMGSIAQNVSGGAYGYRMSKAALNMMSRSLAADLRGENIISVVVSPGWVQTEMGGDAAPTPAAESVSGMLRVIDSLKLPQSGRFFDFRGSEVPW